MLANASRSALTTMPSTTRHCHATGLHLVVSGSGDVAVALHVSEAVLLRVASAGGFWGTQKVSREGWREKGGTRLTAAALPACRPSNFK